MNKSTIALQIPDKLFELTEKDNSVKFSEHIGVMVISWKDKHHHIDTHKPYKNQLKDISTLLTRIISDYE